MTIFRQFGLNFETVFGQSEQDFWNCFQAVPDCVEVCFFIPVLMSSGFVVCFGITIIR